jgi:hypothetical protein
MIPPSGGPPASSPRPDYTPADFAGDHARRRVHGDGREEPEEAKEGQEDARAAPDPDAANADRHELYQASVQNVEAEIDFVDETFRALRGREAVCFGKTSAGPATRRASGSAAGPRTVAFGLDIDDRDARVGPGAHGGARSSRAAGRVSLLERNVLSAGRRGRHGRVLAMNFSYWLFMSGPRW